MDQRNMMIPPSSSFKPILNDQDYMELVCENGKILAKGRRRPNNNNASFENQRTQPLSDLYETEYKNLGDTQIVPAGELSKQHKGQELPNDNNIKKKNIEYEKSLKNIEVIATIPDEQSVAVGRSTELYFTSSSMFSRESSKKYGDIEEEEEEGEESTYVSNNSDDEYSDDAKTQVSPRTRNIMTKRKRSSTENHKLTERKRRQEINKKMRILQDLLPNCYKDDKASLLDEAIIYMRTLQLQVQMISMRNGLLQPPTMLPMGHYSPMGLGMHMNAAAAASVPQFMPMNVQGTGFSGMNNASSSSQMLNFLNHPTGLIPNFTPLENCSHHQQFVVPSFVPHTHQATTTSFTEFPKSASTSNLEDVMQFRGSNGF